MTVGIVGYRSWLAPHFEDELLSRGHSTERVAKGDVPYEDLRRFDALVLIAGRARPTAEEIRAEETLVRLVCEHPRPPRRVVYVSSGAVDRWERGSRPLSRAGEEYVLAKKRCETVVCGRPVGRKMRDGFAIRLPVIFGPGQPLESDMLVPSAIRVRLCHGILELRQPLKPFELVHVTDAARAVADLLEDRDPLPVRSVRSDLHQPMRLVSVLAPGLPIMVGEGWEYEEVGMSEPGQRHLTERLYELRDPDLISTAEWYGRNRMAAIEEAMDRRRLLEEISVRLLPAPDPKGIIDV